MKSLSKILLFQTLLVFCTSQPQAVSAQQVTTPPAVATSPAVTTQETAPLPPPTGPAKKVREIKLPPKKLHPDAAPAPRDNDLSTETKAVLKVVSEKNQKFKIWEAEFTQESFSIGLGQGQFNKGKFHFQYPNKFRYSLISPEVVDYLSDGKMFWQIQYREGKGKPAFVREFADLSKVELDKYLFLLRGIDTLNPKNQARLMKDFVIIGKSIEDELHVILEPRKTTEIIRTTLIFKQKESALYRAILEDALNNKTTITLVSHKILKSMNPKTFVPDFPKESKVEKVE